MQISEMRTVRAFCNQKELLSIIKTKFIPNPCFSPSTSIKNGRLLFHGRSADRRTIHSSNQHHGRESSSDVDRPRGFCGSNSSADELGSSSIDENPRVWTDYDPVSGTLMTRKTLGESEIRDEESASGDEKPVNLSSFDLLEEDLLPRRSIGNVKKPEEESSGDGTARAWSKSYHNGEKSVPRKIGNRVGDNSTIRYGSNFSSQDVVFKKKTGKNRVNWVCSDCGQSYGQWWGTCHSCRSTGTLKQFSVAENVENKTRGFDVSENATGSWFRQKPGEFHPQRLTDVNKGINRLTWRIPLSGLFGAEVSRVLGGGLVPGSLVLVGGDPGVGKSTLLLQIAAMLAEGCDFGDPAPVIYVSGEESIEQIGNRADRMRIGTEQLFLYSSTDIEDILEKIQPLSPRALIVDSVQTVYMRGVTGSAGGLSQVKECTSALLRFAKRTNIPVLLIGHVTKTGDIAGPRVLEHIVDVVLYLEWSIYFAPTGEKYSAHRFLRSVKNRFGSTDELGVFEMSQSGLQAVSNPSKIFLSEQHFDSEVLAGLAVAVIIDGSRTFLIEIQALCLSDSSVERHINGVQRSRADMIVSVLIKQAGLKLQNNAIFINVVSGVTLEETAGDLAIAAAICSSFLEFPIPNDVAFIGEVGLGGELRPVPRMEKRVNAVAKLGYKRCLVPKSAEKALATLGLEGIVILGCKNLKEVIDVVFQVE